MNAYLLREQQKKYGFDSNPYCNLNYSNILNKQIESNKLDEQNNLNNLLKVLQEKKNKIELIDDLLIQDIILQIQKYCENHNKSLNEWFDEKYYDELKILSDNNKKFDKLSQIYRSNSFIKIDNDL